MTDTQPQTVPAREHLSSLFYGMTTDIGRTLALAIATSEMLPVIATDSQIGKELEVTCYLVDLQMDILEKLREDSSRLEEQLMKLGLAP